MLQYRVIYKFKTLFFLLSADPEVQESNNVESSSDVEPLEVKVIWSQINNKPMISSFL